MRLRKRLRSATSIRFFAALLFATAAGTVRTIQNHTQSSDLSCCSPSSLKTESGNHHLPSSTPVEAATGAIPFPIRVVSDFEQAERQLQRLSSRTVSTQQNEARQTVDNILSSVRERGDAALREYTERFDGFHAESFAVPPEALEAARRH